MGCSTALCMVRQINSLFTVLQSELLSALSSPSEVYLSLVRALLSLAPTFLSFVHHLQPSFLVYIFSDINTHAQDQDIRTSSSVGPPELIFNFSSLTLSTSPSLSFSKSAFPFKAHVPWMIYGEYEII
jgi:hypothetical protein